MAPKYAGDTAVLLLGLRLQYCTAGDRSIAMSIHRTQWVTIWRERRKSQLNCERGVQQEQQHSASQCQRTEEEEEALCLGISSCHPCCFMLLPCTVVSVYVSVDPCSKCMGGIPASSVQQTLFSLLMSTSEDKHRQAAACASLTGSSAWVWG